MILRLITFIMLFLFSLCVSFFSVSCGDEKSDPKKASEKTVCSTSDNDALQKKAALEVLSGKTGGAYCSDCQVCVVMENNPSSQVFYLYGAVPFDNTVTFDFTVWDNVYCDQVQPFTGTAPASSYSRVFTVYQSDFSKSWNIYFYYNYSPGRPESMHDDSYDYRLPYMKGKSYKVVQGYNGSFSHKNEFSYSLDFNMKEGDIIYAAREGMVAGVQDAYDGHSLEESYKSRTNYVLIIHDDGTVSEYDHIMNGGSFVSLGQNVKRGEKLARSGNVGYSDSPHLHFMVFKTITGKMRESLPVKFRTSTGSGITLSEGQSYKAVE